MRYRPFALFVTQFCLSLLTMLNAATLAVLPGESIQAQIDAASEGDIVAVFGGTYSEDITINKAIRLVEVSGQDVTILGAVTFDGISDAPPFEGFTVGSGGKDIVVRDTTGLLMRSIDHSAGSYLNITGNSNNTKIVECTLRNFEPMAGVVELVDSSVSGIIEHTDGSLHTTNVTVSGHFNALGRSIRTIAFRTTVAGDCNWNSNRSWFGYSKARSFNFSGSNAKVVVVGSTIDRVNGNADGIQLHGSSNQFTVTNSVVKNVNPYSGNHNNIEIAGGVGNSAKILNNYLQSRASTTRYNTDDYNVRIKDTTDVLIANNIFSNNTDGMVDAPFGVTVLNNLAIEGLTGLRDGVLATNTSTGDPLFVDGDPYQLGPGSPCLNAGTEDPRYNDRDGSRNDIGPSGGAWYDPDGWTTENPVVVAFELSRDQILEGDATPILLQEGLGVSIP